MSKIRVLVVDDSALMRKMIPIILESDSRIEVVDTAMDGLFAIEKIEKAISNQPSRADGVLVKRRRLGGCVPALDDMVTVPWIEQKILRAERKTLMAKDPFRLQGAIGIGDRPLLVLRLEVGLSHFMAQFIEFAERQAHFIKQVAFRPLPDFVGTNLDRLCLVGNSRQTKMRPTALLQ